MFDINSYESVSQWIDIQARGALLELDCLAGLTEEEAFEEVLSIAGSFFGKMEWAHKAILEREGVTPEALRNFSKELTHRSMLSTTVDTAFEIIEDTATDLTEQIIFIAGGLQDRFVLSWY